jgi:phage-related protein
MGFFSDLWEGIRSTAGNVWSGVKNVAGKVYDVVRKPIDIIAGAGKFISKIPVIGSLLSPVTAVASTAQGLLDQAKSVGDVAKSIGLKDGGMVRRKYYQA